ncbi:MAG TPA: hypothetical protein VNT79_07460 [Phycisphaerae bacterium]|nr:hypothetical protein [Phycisphaerae bacterium]
MFPTFVQSFGDQFFAVLINLVGTIGGAIFTSIIGALSSQILTPLFQGIAQSLGIPEAA